MLTVKNSAYALYLSNNIGDFKSNSNLYIILIYSKDRVLYFSYFLNVTFSIFSFINIVCT